MTLLEFVGCSLTAYSPLLAICLFTVFNDPIRIIILVTSAFFWLVSLLVSSIFWNYILFRHLFPVSVVISVVFQELFRYLIYYLFKKAEQVLKKMNVPNTNKDVINNKHIVPFVSGLGFGAMSGCFSLVNILAELAGPGTMGLVGGSEFFCLISSTYTMIFTLLHAFWSVIFFSAVDLRNYFYISWVVGSHLLVSCMTLLNNTNVFYVPLITAFCTLVISAFFAFRVCKGPVQTMSVHEHVQS